MKKRVKIALIIGAVILGIVILYFAVMLSMFVGIRVTGRGMKKAEKYRSCDWGDCVYFTEDDFGEYESAKYKVKTIYGLFSSRGSMYTVTYSDSQYKKQLQKINNMDFIDVPYENEDTCESLISEDKIIKNGWLVRVMEPENEYGFPKKFGMILTNDEEKTIVYMYFTDPDLDFISGTDGEDALTDFIEYYFSFDF